jgi:hypothetical protein
MPSRPPFYFTKDLFLGFDEPAESVPHFLWRFGLFGFDQRLRDADYILVGTSHVWFGLSASLLSQRLSAAAGHPVRVVNLGLGGAEEAFQARILQYRRIKDKAVIIDLYAPAGELNSPWGDEAERIDWAEAYVHVLRVWANGIREWCLDPWLPNFKISHGHLYAMRVIEGVFVCRWDTGDTEYMWVPECGYSFRRGVPPPSTMNIPFDPHAPTPGNEARGAHIVLPNIWYKVIEKNHLRPFLTIVPYNGYAPEAAQRVADLHGWSFISVSPTGLTFRDPDHLNAAGRDLASERLAAGIIGQTNAAPVGSGRR